jgi:hypothetical protein
MLTVVAALLCLLPSNPPDPRLAGAYAQRTAGWAYVHLKGSPKQIGFQYGSLLSPEIDDAQKALHECLKRETFKDWDYYRTTAKKLFWDKVDPEYQQEMIGQAEGLQSKGLIYDQWDVLAMNGYIEIADYYLPWLSKHPSTHESCSAFVATGKETKDGKIVMGQNFWWDYEMGERFNAILDIQPEKGHRLVMDALCGLIESATDFAINDAGLLVTETTLPNLKDFDPNGIPEFVRMRKATQYAGSLDEFAAIMKQGNNGGYANTWLLGDTKTNEIGKLELGMKNITFDKTKDGAFYGANFPENPKLISEEMDPWDPNPATNGCEARKVRWEQLIKQYKGSVDVDIAKDMISDTVNYKTGQPGKTLDQLCGETPLWGANNGKVVTSDLASKMTFWARMGYPDGSSYHFQGAHSPLLRDIVSQPWIVVPPK